MKIRALVLLSGEQHAIPGAEARALFQAYDPDSRFEAPEDRVLIAETTADPMCIGGRIAFSRRVGLLLSDPSDAAEIVKGKKVRVRCYTLFGTEQTPNPGEVLGDLDVEVDLKHPDFEFTLIRGHKTYLMLSSPESMNQGWSLRRPRKRPFFHPAAIFPKLSRALVNLAGCKEGEVFLDPFVGTGSLTLEAWEVGATPVALDISERMARGALSNMRAFKQEWLGVIRCDSLLSPLLKVQSVATDIPYGRASSTEGRRASQMADHTLSICAQLMDGGSRLVIMHPSTIPVRGDSEWSFVEELQLHVHKRLTRTISILKRR